MAQDYEVTLGDIRAARERIGALVRRTPLTTSEAVSRRLGARAYLKLELFQKTGSFKPRGAFNKVLGSGLKPGDRVAAASGGNHAQGVAYAASRSGLRSTIFMPRNTPVHYLNATMEYGAEVVLTADIAEAFEKMIEAERAGATVIHPFDDPLVVAGQGTCGLEILEDLPETTDIIVSIGGGGLAAGIAIAVKSAKPEVRVWGVETEGADAMSQALAAGHPVRLDAITSVAKTLGAPEVTPAMMRMAERYLECVTVVPDTEAVAAVRLLLERAKVMTEPSAGCTLAAAERLRKQFGPERHVVLVLCGGNWTLGELEAFTAAEQQRSA